MSSSSWWRWGVAALAVATALLVIAPSSSLPPFNPMGTQSVFTPADPDYVAVIEPVLRAPWRGDRPWTAGVLVALGAVAAFFWAARTLRASLLAAWFAATALFVSAPFSAGARFGADTVIAAALLWISWGVMGGEVQTGSERVRGVPRGSDRLGEGPTGSEKFAQVPTDYEQSAQVGTFERHQAAGRAVLGVALWATAVVVWWMAILAVPVTVAAATRSAGTWRTRVLATLGIGVAGMTGVALSFVRVSWLAGASPVGAPAALTTETSWWDVARVVFGAAPHHLTPSLPVSGGGPESLLPLLLVTAAIMFGPPARWLRVGLALLLALTGIVWLEWPGWRGALVRWSAWVLTPFVAVGLTWLTSQTRPRRRTASALGVGALLVVSALSATLYPSQRREMRAFGDWMQSRYRTGVDAASEVQFVSEDVLVDAAMVAWGAASLVPQSSTAIANALRVGTTLLAGPSARMHLELLGFRFTTVDSLEDPVAYRLSTVRQQLRCATLRSDRWSVLPGLEYTGRVGFQIPPSAVGGLVLIVGDTLPVQLRAATEDGRMVALSVRRLPPPPSPDAPPTEYWFEAGDPLAVPQQVVRAEIPALAARTFFVGLHLGRRAPRVLARLSGHGDDARGRVCAAAQEVDALWESAPFEAVDVPLRSAALFGRGWHAVEGGEAAYRWSEGDAAVLLPSARAGPLRVAIEAAPAADVHRDGPEITLAVNGMVEPPRAMRPGTSVYAWFVPSRRWMRGTNELLFSVSQTTRPADQGRDDTRTLGLRVSRITLTPE